MPLSDKSHLSSSPSLTSSVDSATSSSISSPKGQDSDLVIEPKHTNSNIPLDNGCIKQRRMSTSDTLAHPRHFSISPPSSPAYRSPNRQGASLETRFSNTQRQRYQPYTPRSGYVLPGLLYAARSLGITSPTDLTVDGIEESRDGFVSALSALPDRILLLALDLKRADYDRLALQLALTTAEINFTEQRRAFLSSMRDQNDGALAVGGECLDILEQVLGIRGLAEHPSNQEYHRNARAEELVALTLAESHVAQLQDVIGPQGPRWLGEDGGVDKVFSEEDAEEDSDDEDNIAN